MQIIPTLELMDGRCVSLEKGDLRQPIIWHVDPIATAQSFAAAGASVMRITDFDAIKGAENSPNSAIIIEIIRQAGISVQVAGGMRSAQNVTDWINLGAAQVVVGSLAAHAPDTVLELSKFHPAMIMLSLDVYQGHLMTNGWRNRASFTAEAVLAAYGDAPLAGVVMTDIDSDIDEVDAKLGVISGLASMVSHPVVAGGVVRNLDDVARLKYVANISGALVGRALFRKNLDLCDALAMAHPEAEEVASFI